MKTKILTAAALSVLILTACTDESKVASNTNGQVTQELTGNNNASGASKDGALIDGVRPEVADYLKRRYRGENYEAAMQYARSAQTVLDADTTNQDDMMKIYEDYLQEMTCLHARVPTQAVDEYENSIVIDVNGITLEGGDHLERFTNFQKGLPTTDFPLGNPDKC